MPNPTPRIVVVALNPSIDRGIEVPNFTLGAHQTVHLLFRRPAGKPVNVAHTLGAIGKIPTRVIGFIGQGQREYFETYLNLAGVDCQFLPVPGDTRENITLVDPVRRVDTHLRDRGFTVTSADVAALRTRLAEACSRDVFVVFNGSLPPGLTVGDFVGLVQICRTNEARVCLDVAGPVLRACMDRGIWLVKPNALELSEMLERPLEHRAQILAAGRELAQRVEVAIVSVGKDGAFLFAGLEYLHGKIPLDPAEVMNTVGCGDALLAGFLMGIAAGQSRRDSFALALAVATASAASITPGEIPRSDVDRLLPCAVVNEV
jgi:1-phosphofructokinase family hexose kinase